MRLLFVCTGNVCRSLIAERLCAELARRGGLAVEARSCGIAADYYFRPPPEVWTALAEAGVPEAPHRPQLIGRALLDWADEALVMTRRQLEFVRAEFPDRARKAALLRERAGLAGEVSDPLGRPLADFRACRDSIREALETILARGPRG